MPRLNKTKEAVKAVAVVIGKKRFAYRKRLIGQTALQVFRYLCDRDYIAEDCKVTFNKVAMTVEQLETIVFKSGDRLIFSAPEPASNDAK